jgi:hypothetical protein
VRGDDVLSLDEMEAIELGFLQFLPAELVEGITFAGTDQNSYVDSEQLTSPMPPGFFEDFGSFLSQSSRDALGASFYDHLTGASIGTDPETALFQLNRNLPNLMKQAGVSDGQDFQLNSNGVRINFYYFPGTPAHQEEDGGFVISSGFYRSIVEPINPHDQTGSDDFVSALTASVAGTYRTFNSVDWGDPVPLINANGERVLDLEGNVIYRPSGRTPADLFNHGRRHQDTPWTQIGTVLQYLFGTEGRYDFQRQAGSFHPAADAHRGDRILPTGEQFHREYVSFSTVGIGLFAAGAGISLHEILTIQNNIAGRTMMSSWPASMPRHSVYTHLPQLNVRNTEIGYNWFSRGS